MEENVLICEDSQIGIFTGIYEAYARKFGVDTVRLAVGEENDLRLFAVYHRIEPDEEKAEKVARTIRELAGEENFRQLCMTLSSCEEDKAQVVFRTVILIIRDKKNACYVMNRLADSCVRRVFEIERNVRNEMGRFREFLRFKEIANRVLFARIKPQNDVVVYLMLHFANRFPLENFLIYDEAHHLLGVHEASKEWYLIREFRMDDELLRYTEEEDKYAELFRYFCHRISIKERENLKLQRNMLPLKFRGYMTEFE